RDACVPLSLALHELCTNAAKYGALSTPAGRVTERWTVGEDEEGLLRRLWREEGGPAVTPPARAGMGTQLLRRRGALSRAEGEYCLPSVPPSISRLNAAACHGPVPSSSISTSLRKMRPPEGSASKLLRARSVLVSADQSWNTLAKKCASGPVGQSSVNMLQAAVSTRSVTPARFAYSPASAAIAARSSSVTLRPGCALAISMP